MPDSQIDPALFARADAAIVELERAIQELESAIVDIHDAFVHVYPPDGSMEWFTAYENGRLGALWDRLEQLERLNLSGIIDAACG